MGVILVLAIAAGTARQQYGGGVVCDYAGDVVLAGAKLWQFIAIIGMGISAVVLLILAEPYRIRRVTAFWNPWEDPFGSGYQLTQSLMAFGRGELWGQGLGNSVQNWSICRKRTLTLFSPLSAKNWDMSVWCWHF